MKIHVPMPEEAKLPEVGKWQYITVAIDDCLPIFRALAEAAFVKEQYAAWVKVQQILYHWNKKFFLEQARVDDIQHTLIQVLRNYLVSQQTAYLEKTRPINLNCYNDFTVDKAIDELYAAAKSHSMNQHPYLVHMSQYGLEKHDALQFLENWNTDSYIFHLYIAAQSLSTPFELRGELYHNLYEELGEGDINKAHPVIYLKNYETIEANKVVEPLPESLYMFNMQVYYTQQAGNYRKGLGGLGFIELNVPEQMQQIYSGLKKSGLPEKDLLFWPLHIELDSEHGEAWFEEMRSVISTPDDALAMLEGGVRVLDARASMLNALHMQLKQKAA